MQSRVIEGQASPSTSSRTAAEAAVIMDVDAVVQAKPQVPDDAVSTSLQAPWLIAATIIPHTVNTGANHTFYCFELESEAQDQLRLIRQLLIGRHPDIVKASVKHAPKHNVTPYRIFLTLEQHHALEKIKASDQLVKVIRWDEKCFIHPFMLGITRTPHVQHRQKLRSAIRGHYTVYATGVYSRTQKPSRYTAAELSKKAELSQHQSTSLITHDAQSPVFGHNKDRRNKLVGVMLDPADALINRLYTYDGGTVNRPYESDIHKKVEGYFKRVTNPASQKLFPTVDSFIVALRKHINQHNEVLARIRWNIKSSSIAIFSDTFEARCIAQFYAEQMLRRLKQQYTELGKKWDENYVVPIRYYLPGNPKNWTAYTENDQQADMVRAQAIFNDIDERHNAINAGDGEFLLILPDAENTFHTLESDSNHPLIKIIIRGQFQLLSAIHLRAQTNDSLNYALRVYAQNFLASLDKLAKQNILEKLNHDLLHLAVEAGSLDVVVFILLLQPNFLNVACKDGASVIYTAALHGHVDMVNLLLEIGVDSQINEVNLKTANTPLFIAAQNGHLEIVKVLLVNGAKPDLARTTDGATPLYIAAQNGHLEIVKVLLANGAKPDLARTTDGATPLFIAAQLGHLEIVKVLLANGAKLDQARTDGATPLFIAAQEGHIEIVKVLLANGAKLDQACTDSATPRYIAAHNGHHEIVRLLNRQRLLNYLTERNNDPRDYQRSYTFFGRAFNLGFSKEEKVKAAVALLNAVDCRLASSVLKEHVQALNNGELGDIYRAFSLGR